MKTGVLVLVGLLGGSLTPTVEDEVHRLEGSKQILIFKELHFPFFFF